MGIAVIAVLACYALVGYIAYKAVAGRLCQHTESGELLNMKWRFKRKPILTL